MNMHTDGIIIGDLNGYIIEVNEAIIRMNIHGSKEDFVGKHILDFLPEVDRNRAAQDSLDSIISGQGKTSEYCVISKSGQKIPVEVTIAFIKDAQGKKIGFIDVVRNLSNSIRMKKS
ncbi:MAG: PAS domain-containing protein [Candidatus Bathyarchaeia archaeon]